MQYGERSTSKLQKIVVATLTKKRFVLHTGTQELPLHLVKERLNNNKTWNYTADSPPKMISLQEFIMCSMFFVSAELKSLV